MQPGERIDPVTGFADARTLEVTADLVLAHARQKQQSVSIVVIRLEDACADSERSMSLALRASVRGTDHLFKIAERALVVLLPSSSLDGVAKVLLRAARLCDPPFSYGVATTQVDGWDIRNLVARATDRVREFPLAI